MSRFRNPAAVHEFSEVHHGLTLIFAFEYDIDWDWYDLGDFFGSVAPNRRGLGDEDLDDNQELIGDGRNPRRIWTKPSDADAEQIDSLREWIRDILAERILVGTVSVIAARGLHGEEYGSAYLGIVEIDIRKDIETQIREVVRDNGMEDEAIAEADRIVRERIEDLLRIAAALDAEAAAK